MKMLTTCKDKKSLGETIYFGNCLRPEEFPEVKVQLFINGITSILTDDFTNGMTLSSSPYN